MWQLLLTCGFVASLGILPPAAAWDTRYDQLFQFSCHNNQVMSGIRSVHSNPHEDRLFDFSCGNLPQPATIRQCTWSGYVNDFDQPVSYICPANKVMVGINSYHSNHAEDRRFKFLCCRPLGKIAHNCAVSGFANNFDQPLNYVVPRGRVLTGMFSYHHNHFEDRRFRFVTCILGNLA